MTKLLQEVKEYIELNMVTSNRTLVGEIYQKFDIKTTHTTVGKEKKEILERMERKLEIVEPKKPRKSVPIIQTRKKYCLVTKGILEDMIREAIKGEINISPKLRDRMKKGYPEEPFEGDRVGSGGWNSISYAVFNVLVNSKCVYIKKE